MCRVVGEKAAVAFGDGAELVGVGGYDRVDGELDEVVVFAFATAVGRRDAARGGGAGVKDGVPKCAGDEIVVVGGVRRVGSEGGVSGDVAAGEDFYRNERADDGEAWSVVKFFATEITHELGVLTWVERPELLDVDA